MGLIKKKKLELPNLNLTSTNNNSSVQIGSEDGRKIYRKKIGGGFSLAVKKGRLQNLENNKSVIIDQSPRQEERKSKATISPNEQIIQIIKSRKLKKAKNLASNAKFKSKSSKNSYDEYCHFVRITQKALKIGKKSLFISFWDLHRRWKGKVHFVAGFQGKLPSVPKQYGRNQFKDSFGFRYQPFRGKRKSSLGAILQV